MDLILQVGNILNIKFDILDNTLKCGNILVKFDKNIIMLDDKSVNNNTKHFQNLINKNNIKEITEYNVYNFCEIIKNNHGYCALCYNKIINLNKVNVCDNCTDESYKCVIDDCISESYVKDNLTTSCLILFGYSCLQHPNKSIVFKPLPKQYDDITQIEKNLIFSNNKYEELLNILDLCNNDNEIYDKIGRYDYEFIKFLIKSNKTILKPYQFFNTKKNIFDEEKIHNVLKTKEILSLQIQYDNLTEDKFKTICPNYLFHGSPLSNWYSILKNGVKNLSNTKLMACGAAYGSGVYLSDTLSVSLSYGIDKYCKLNKCVIGVVQVLDDIEKHKKSQSIYVVENDSILLLRYIIIMNSSNAEKVTNYFMKEIKQKIEANTKNFFLIKGKRLGNEIELLTKFLNKNDMSLVVENNWRIVSDNYEILIEIPIDYPTDAPFIMINSHNKNLKNTYVSILKNGGMICPDLIQKNWKSSNSINSICRKIIKYMELSDNMPTKYYDRNEALKEYSDAVKAY